MELAMLRLLAQALIPVLESRQVRVEALVLQRLPGQVLILEQVQAL